MAPELMMSRAVKDLSKTIDQDDEKGEMLKRNSMTALQYSHLRQKTRTMSCQYYFIVRRKFSFRGQKLEITS